MIQKGNRRDPPKFLQLGSRAWSVLLSLARPLSSSFGRGAVALAPLLSSPRGAMSQHDSASQTQATEAAQELTHMSNVVQGGTYRVYHVARARETRELSGCVG